jgi:hypothetical protein
MRRNVWCVLADTSVNQALHGRDEPQDRETGSPLRREELEQGCDVGH